MADPRARFILTADDRATRTLRRVRGEIKGLGSAIRALAPIGAGFTLSASITQMIDEAERGQRQLFKLEQLVRSTGGTAGLTAEQIDGFSRALAGSTLASTEGVRDAAGALLTFRTISGDTFKETLSLAQDLAATFGGDLRSKVVQLGKALEDPARGVSALAESGVSFNKVEKDLIKTLQDSGRQLDAQRIIIEKVREQVGGAGAAEAGGLSGAVDTLSQNWSEFLENIGNSGPLQAANSFIEGLATRVETLNRALFASERQQFDELIERRRLLQRQIEKIELFKGVPTGLKRQLAEIDVEIRALQDKNIARIKRQGEVEAAAAAAQQGLATPPATAAGSAGSGPTRPRGLSDAQKELNALLEDGRRLTEALLTPQERYQAQIENLNRLRDASAIGQATYNRALVDYQDQLDAALGANERFAALQGVIAEVDPVAPLLAQLDALRELEAAYPRYAEIIGEAMFRVQDEIDAVNDGLVEQQDQVEDVRDSWQSLGPVFASAFEDAIVEGKQLSAVLRGLEQDLVRIITRKAITEPLGEAVGDLFTGAGGGSGGGFGGFLRELLPFAAGGSFMVGGSGGTDSQLVAFRASPNERVTVETPGQRRARAGNTFNFTFALPADNVNYRRAGAQVAREAARVLRVAQGAT